ncbi:MAG: bis(5'-nucleosyl)-tetraphosphatase (symmetrical) YqeK [Lachnospiraceae bacterium]|nr:bis(5'-nucleosyl)-tetraphosphatase (symmetrical) YqeK [Lachnospiraceae bacterium]
MIKSSEIDKIQEDMADALDDKRFMHTLGVAYTAAALAMRYEIDMNTAYVTGLLHDCAKCISDKKKLSICKKNHIPVSETEQQNPSLLHAKVGAFLAEDKYDIADKSIIDAIAYHTTGRPNMSDLEQIIYIADYIEPGRNKAPNLDEIRHMAFIDKEQALIKILEDSLFYLNDSNQEVDLITQQTYEYYKNK